MKHIVGMLFAFLLSFFRLAALSDADKAFIEKYRVDAALQAVLDDHCDDILEGLKSCNAKSCRMRHAIWRFSWLPDYIIKHDISRVKGAEIIKKCAQELNLDLIAVPDKRLYHVKGKPEELTNLNYVVVENTLAQEELHLPLNLRQVEQFCSLVKKTGYATTGRKHNYLRLKDNKIGIIDTETQHFTPRRIATHGLMRFIYDKRGHNYNLNTDITEEALKYIILELAKAYADRSDSDREWAHMVVVRRMQNQGKPFAWDYLSFFEEHFPKPRQIAEEQIG